MALISSVKCIERAKAKPMTIKGNDDSVFKAVRPGKAPVEILVIELQERSLLNNICNLQPKGNFRKKSTQSDFTY